MTIGMSEKRAIALNERYALGIELALIFRGRRTNLDRVRPDETVSLKEIIPAKENWKMTHILNIVYMRTDGAYIW